ncbi:MAG: tetratricopeptide repeat protein [Bacteroidota bacterium]
MLSNHLILFRLAELMLDREQHVLSVDDLFDDEQIGDFVKSVQIDSPYQQMILEGVLTESVRDEKLFVSFTVEGYFHYVLGEVIYNQYNHRSSNDLLQLVRNSGLNGVKEGATQCFIRQADRGNIKTILDFIDAGEDIANLCVVPLGMAFLSANNSNVLDRLLEHESENDFRVLDAVLQFLDSNNKHQAIDGIWQQLIFRLGEFNIKSCGFHKARMLIQGIAFRKDEFLESLTGKIMDEGKSYFKGFSRLEKGALLMDYYNLLVNKGQLPLAYRFAMKFGLYAIEPALLVQHYYNILYPLLELGKFKKAESIYLRCEPIYRNDGFFLNWSGWIYQSWYELKSGDKTHLETGLGLYQNSTALIDEAYGRYSIRKYQNLENLGYTYNLIEQYDTGLAYLDQAIAIVTKSYRTDITYKLGNLYEMKAGALSDVGRYDDALQHIDKSDQCKLLQVGPETSEMSWNYETRARILLAMGNRSGAKEAFKKSLDIREAELGSDNEITKQSRMDYEAI